MSIRKKGNTSDDKIINSFSADLLMVKISLKPRLIYLSNSRLRYVAHIQPKAIVNTKKDVITYTKTINNTKLIS